MTPAAGPGVPPFTLRFDHTRRHRAEELFPWLPALCGSVGFGIGVAYLVTVTSPWFLLLLALPPLLYPGLFALLVDLAVHARRPVEVVADADGLTITTGGATRRLPYAGVIQVYRSGADWVVLHRDGSSLALPAGAATEEQLAFLKGFARRAFEARKAARG